jgi:hypothetical protein
MRAVGTVCSSNYQYKSNENSPPSPISDLSSTKGAMDDTPYLTCTERLACEKEMSSKATFYCAQCNSLQCILCEKQLHENPDNTKHERINLDDINDEFCSVDRQHQAVFYCPTCALLFCYSCYENRHQHSDGREHRPQKCRQDQIVTTKKNK